MDQSCRYRFKRTPPWKSVVFFSGLITAVSLIPTAFRSTAQNPTGDETPTAVVRLRVRPKVDGKEKGLARKRFYLFQGSLAENQALVTKLTQQPVLSRECYYRGIEASDALIDWLNKNDCESVYCRAIEMESVNGPAAVPEFRTAFSRAPKEYRTPELKLGWLTTLLPDPIRDGFYRRKQAVIGELLGVATNGGHNLVSSVMTDRNGTAYFTDLKPGTYTLTNLLPTEFGKNSILWTCELKVKPEDATLEKPYQISNVKDNRAKCVGVETPLPACPSKTAGAAK